MNESLPQRNNTCSQLLDRRAFLKSSGLVAVCLGVFPVNVLAIASGIDKKTDQQKYAPGIVLGNPGLCGGCRRCEIVCSAAKHPEEIRPESSLIKFDRKRFDGLFKLFSPLWHPDTCRQCKEDGDSPWCVNSCPTGACHIDSKTGIRIINQETCIGCGSCVEECPYQMPLLDILASTPLAPDGAAAKCDLCHGRPACVSECPSSALKFYTPWVSKINI